MTDTSSTAVDELITRMTLREKIGQLNQRLFGWECVRRVDGRWRLTDTFRAELDRWDGMGALYGMFRADPWSGRSWADGIHPDDRAEVAAMVSDAVRAGSSQGIPPLLVEEAPHGHQALGGTILPVPLNLAATWDPALVEEAARAVAAELAASGVHIALVSALDVLRDPRWGRSEECLGESPMLAAEMAAALVRGMQGPQRSALGQAGVGDGTGVRSGLGSGVRTGVGVVLKHFAAQGEAMGGRNGQSAVIGPRDLREIHLPPAEAGVRAGAVGVMAAYNDIDGVPCCANPELLRDILRREWGFDGMVMADGHAIDRLESVAGSLPAAARLALLSGVDISLWDEAFTRLEEVADGDEKVRDAIDAACRRVLHVKQLLGLVPDGVSTAQGDTAVTDEPVAHRHPGTTQSPADLLEAARAQARELSAELARRSLVLLGDDADVLPLSLNQARRVLVIGPHAGQVTALLGDYVAPLEPDSRPTRQHYGHDSDHNACSCRAADRETPSVLQALRKRLAPGARLDHVPSLQPDVDLDALAAAADVVIAVLGGTSHRSYDDEFTDVGAVDVTAGGGPARATSGEGVDLADLGLPGDQDTLLARVRGATDAPVVAVVVAGRAHVLTSVLAHGDATLWAGYPGPYGADAVLDVLTGVRAATGRLPMTLPGHPGVVPIHHDDRHEPAGVYADATDPVLRPFGYGTSTGPIHIQDAEVIPAAEADADVDGAGDHAGCDTPSVRLRVTLENTGSDDADDVVQVYAHRPDGVAVPRLRELVAFTHVTVPACGTQIVEIDVPSTLTFVVRAGTSDEIELRH
ncbi:glycoside hydrolase family 3 protein [Phytoactinopolyspora halotolerans]|uniref:Beta-glucosidase n=1 Tax=Phytoactinopolyspora halotolerans TaxID=1981512 RepID=A0A6L9SDI2_9ACTN|nr:glycoside hydrolase family 3 N-terminal domain-containing protein [Phytoactinopolyspora halotolerans]NEE02644.1 beta-glucosidase [Phytoactinopolyspora halotolerans]